jgi:HK97 family phage prohead protease
MFKSVLRINPNRGFLSPNTVLDGLELVNKSVVSVVVSAEKTIPKIQRVVIIHILHVLISNKFNYFCKDRNFLTMEKTIKGYSTKSQNLKIKDLNEGSREVAVYLAHFDNVDADNDIIRRGAFSKSIQERGPQSQTNRKIAFLRFHNWEMPIGKFESLQEDENGLFAVAKLGTSTLGNDAFNDYKDGIIREHSIGFKYIKDKIKFVETDKDGGGFYEVSEVALFEGSAVTFGANDLTNVVEVAKTQGKGETAQKIADEINIVTKAIFNGQGTDERQYNLEMKLKFLNEQMLTLATVDPFNKQSIKSEPKEIISFDWNIVNDKINY